MRQLKGEEYAAALEKWKRQKLLTKHFETKVKAASVIRAHTVFKKK
jgi:hypothetical protein